MVVQAQSSQRETCPPSAAVRQLSIADMTFIWSRLSWPALACRHAGPWPAKISETSQDGTGTDAALVAGRPKRPELEGDVLERAHDVLDRLGGHPRIERGRVELGVTEQDLDHPDIDVLLQQMGGEAVAERVWRHILLDPGRLCGGTAGAIELACGHRLGRIAAGKQPALRPCRPPPGAQQFEQAGREHHIAILMAFALLHTDDHPLAVDVTDLERNDFGST